jgi:hypothetical protein
VTVRVRRMRCPALGCKAQTLRGQVAGDRRHGGEEDGQVVDRVQVCLGGGVLVGPSGVTAAGPPAAG